MGVLLTFGVYPNSSQAAEFGEIQYNNTYIDYSKIDKATTKKLADFYFKKAATETDKKLKLEYLQKASGEYFIWNHTEPENIYPIIQMARVYDMEDENSYAKAYFFQALKINKDDAQTNYYFGNYYYKRGEYTKAIHFYDVALSNGWKESSGILLRMGTMYEKLGDLVRANQYYKKAFLVNPNNQKVPDRIRSLETINYKNTGYYNFKRK